MLFRTRYNVLFRQFRLLTAQAGAIPAAIRLIFENCYKQIDELKAKMDECRSTTTGDIVDQKSYDALDQQRKQLQTNLKLAQQLEDIAAKSALAKAKAQYH